MARTWRSRFIAAALGVLTVATGATELFGEAEAQTVQGDLRIVMRLQQPGAFGFAWVPSGTHLAVGYINIGYAIWDALTGRKVGELNGQAYSPKNLQAVAFTPDGRHLIVEPYRYVFGDPKSVSLALWNIETGAIDREIIGPSAVVRFAVSNAASRLAVLYANDRVVLYDTRKWGVAATWVADRNASNALAFEPSGRLLALGGGSSQAEYRGDPMGGIWVYEAASGRLVATVREAHQDHARLLAFLGDSGRIASTASQAGMSRNVATNRQEEVRDAGDALRIWSATTGASLESIPIAIDNPFSLASSADGRLLGLAVTINADLGVPPSYVVWDAATGAEIGRLRGTGTFFDDSAFSSDGRFVAISHRRLRGGTFEVLVVEIGGQKN